MPIRNKADFIARCLRSLRDGDYTGELEILVIDGMSDDGTRAIVEQAAQDRAAHSPARNPDRIVPHAMNIGIRAARGDHPPRGRPRQGAGRFRQPHRTAGVQEHPECRCAGGPIETVSPTFVGRTIAAAMSTPVSMGNAMFPPQGLRRLRRHDCIRRILALGIWSGSACSTRNWSATRTMS